MTLRAADLDSTALQVAVDGETALGVVQVSRDGSDAILEKLFVEPERLRGGVGGALFRWAVESARALGAYRIVIEADPDAVPFYERMGAVVDGTAPSGSIPGRQLPRLVLAL